ncbi:hypothetical protein HCH52_00400 [Oscillospiraceae bacterium HV4-5-C5C]|nr:hypothetical protein [Oscillospiraceae bacterium HV4-5-C5C]
MSERILTSLAAGLLALTLSACQASPGSSTTRALTGDSGTSAGSALTTAGGSDSQSGSSEETDAVALTSAASAAESAADAAATMPETIILRQDGLTITAKSLEDDPIWGLGIKLNIENQTDRNLLIQSSYAAVDQYMTDALFSCSVAAGKMANDTLYLGSSALEAAGITDPGEISLHLSVADSDSYETVLEPSETVLKTSAYEQSTVPEPTTEGIELLNQDGIRIIASYVDESSFWGTGILLYLENQTEQDILVQCDNMSVNDMMITPYFSSTVFTGCRGYSEITLLSSDLEENGITSIDKAELTFNIYNASDYSSLIQTDPLLFTTGS